MHETKKKEDIHISYVSALCASAGIDYEAIRHDDDSTDAMIKKRITRNDGCFYDAQLRIQLKCTSSKTQYSISNDVITYHLKAKNYNDLCTPSTTPIILGLLILQDNESEWVNWSTEELLIKGSMYWVNFEGHKKTDNTSTVAVHIPIENTINQNSLTHMLERIAEEGGL